MGNSVCQSFCMIIAIIMSDLEPFMLFTQQGVLIVLLNIVLTMRGNIYVTLN